MLILAILLDLFDQISKVNSSWSVAAFTVTAILLALRYVAKVGKGKGANSIILICVGLMFLMGLAPIIASMIIPKPAPVQPGKEIPYNIITVVKDPSNLIHDAADLVVSNSLSKPISRVNNGWAFNVTNEDLTSDSLINITAQTTNKLLWGDTTIRITKSLNYTATIMLKRIPDSIRKKTFSLSSSNTDLIRTISEQTGLTNTGKSSDYKITVSYAANKLIHNTGGPDGPDTYMLDACYPIITINGITCAQVKCCKIEGTGRVTDKGIITNYANDKLRGSAEKCYQEQINNIIACLKRK